MGNIPLNDLLDQKNLEDFSLDDAKKLRYEIETKWNHFNMIRTIASSFAFILLIVACFLISR